jgi:hypothetical protein
VAPQKAELPKTTTSGGFLFLESQIDGIWKYNGSSRKSNCLFTKEIKYVKVDMTAMEYLKKISHIEKNILQIANK